MRSIDDLQALHALLLTSSYFYNTFKPSEFAIIESVLHQALGELLPFAYRAASAPMVRHDTGPRYEPCQMSKAQYEGFLSHHLCMMQLPMNVSPVMLVSICKLHNCVTAWTQRLWQSVVVDEDFRGPSRECHCALTTNSPIHSQDVMAHNPNHSVKMVDPTYSKITCSGHEQLNRKEAARIQRAFYRFELFSRIFGPRATVFYPNSNIWDKFFISWPPWEIEEFFSVYSFLQHQFRARNDSPFRSWYRKNVRIRGMKSCNPSTSLQSFPTYTNLYTGLEQANKIFDPWTIRHTRLANSKTCRQRWSETACGVTTSRGRKSWDQFFGLHTIGKKRTALLFVGDGLMPRAKTFTQTTWNGFVIGDMCFGMRSGVGLGGTEGTLFSTQITHNILIKSSVGIPYFA